MVLALATGTSFRLAASLPQASWMAYRSFAGEASA
jgi:hypothetical protein